MVRSGRSYALAVLDVMMPDGSGVDVHGVLREVSPATQVLFSSGYAAEALPFDIDRGPRAAFISKPYDMATLLRKVRELIGQT